MIEISFENNGKTIKMDIEDLELDKSKLNEEDKNKTKLKLWKLYGKDVLKLKAWQKVLLKFDNQSSTSEFEE